MKKLNDYAYGLIQAKIADLEVAYHCRELKVQHNEELVALMHKNFSGDSRQKQEIGRLAEEHDALLDAQEEISAKIEKYNSILEESDSI